MTPLELRAPFPYFGGKSRAAAEVWRRLGRVTNYVEPCFGSGACLLARPLECWVSASEPGTETVNDADGLLANAWRALAADPDAVAHYADWPVSELDLHARHRWLVNQRADVERLLADPAWFDPQAAGWWLWGISQWIGSGWCPADRGPARKRPAIGGRGKPSSVGGVHRAEYSSPASVADVGELPMQLPHVGNAGRGVHRASHAHAERRCHGQLPKIGEGGGGGSNVGGILRQEYRADSSALSAYFRALSARLRRVRVCCGDAERVLGPSVTFRHGLTGVFLDPPYDLGGRTGSLYAVETEVAKRLRAWAIENGDNPLLRIALCGYAGEHQMPVGWTEYAWKARGGYGSQGEGRGRANAVRERIWFSPHCLNPDEDARTAMTRPIVAAPTRAEPTPLDRLLEEL